MNVGVQAFLGWAEIIAILAAIFFVAASIVGLVFLVVWLVRRDRFSHSPAPTAQNAPPSTATCPKCGAALPGNSPQGLCPRCVLEVGMATQTEAEGEVGPNGTKVAKPSPAPEEIAARFPQLEILECLGRGGMGVVYKARQPKLNRRVALKILAPEKDSDPRFAERFSREAQALARLNHPNIVTVYDFGETDGMFFLLMEYVDGASLRDLIRQRRLKPEEALAIVPKICEALQFAHNQGVVHRDIKPENVLLDKEGRVKIADFGIAKIVGEEAGVSGLTQDQVIGTPHYMAPEQVEKPQTVDHRADIYSLGVVFYEMLTGELPLGKFALPSHKVRVDVRLDEVVLHALEKEPERRYQHASEVKTDVETIAAGAKSEIRNPMSEVSDAAITKSGAKAETPDTGWINVVRWIARILGTLLLLFFGTFIVAEGLPAIAAQPGGVQLNFVALGLMLGGFIVGWRKDGTAALLIAAGWTLWHISEGRFEWNLFQTPLLVAALYTYCWWASRGRRTGLLAGTVVALAVAFALGRLFVPANVFVKGLVSDAATGDSITNASLTFVSRGPTDTNATSRPNARTDKKGRFRLYVGWYDGQTEVSVASPGYATLTTNLGPRAFGRRMVERDFQLEPATGVRPEENSGGESAMARPVADENQGATRPLAYQWWAGEGTNRAATNEAGPATANAATNPVPRITMENVPLRDAIQDCANQVHLNVLFDPQLEFDRSGPNGRSVLQIEVNVKWENVTIQTALKTLLDTYGLTLRTDPASGIARVSKKSAESNAVGVLVPPPVVIRAVPESGASAVDPKLTELRVTFSKPMKDGSWSWCDLGDGTFPEMTGQPRYLQDGRTCVLPVKLQPGRTYATWINVDQFQDFKDRDGQPAVPYLLIFQTKE